MTRLPSPSHRRPACWYREARCWSDSPRESAPRLRRTAEYTAVIDLEATSLRHLPPPQLRGEAARLFVELSAFPDETELGLNTPRVRARVRTVLSVLAAARA